MLVAAVLTVMGCVTERIGVADASAPSQAGARATSGAPPPPSPVPPNASRIVADVLDRRVFSLTLSVASSTAQAPEYENLVLPGSKVEAFSSTAMPAEIVVGTRIEAVLTLAGDSRGTRWWVSRVRVLP